MERDENLFNADGIDPKELENYKLVQCVAFYMQSSLLCFFFMSFIFKISLAYICLLFLFYSRTIMAQLKVSQVQRFVKFCEQNNHDFYLYVRFC